MLLCCGASAQALAQNLAAEPSTSIPAGWSLQIDAVRSGELVLSEIRGRLAVDEAGQWQLREGRLLPSHAGERYGQLRFEAAPVADRWQGTLRWLAGDGLSLQGDWQVDGEGKVGVDLAQRRIRINGALDALLIELRSLPLAPWRRWLGQRLGWTPDRLDGEASADLRWDGVGLSGQVSLSQMGFDTSDGRRAAAGVAVQLELDSTPDWRFDLTANAGEVLWDEIYVPLPDVGLQLKAVAESGGWQLAAAEPDVFDARVNLGPGSTPSWQLDARVADLARWHERYLKSYFEARAWAAIAPAGSVQLTAAGAATEPQQISVQASVSALSLATMSIEGIELDAAWRAAGEGHLQMQTSATYWSGLSLAGWSLDARQRGSNWSLREPLVLGLLGGSATLSQLDVALAERPWHAQAALALDNLDLAGLMQALEWTPLPGRLSAEFPGVRIEPQRLEFEGGAEIEAFDGTVSLSAIGIERPLGPAPAIQGGFEFSGLDLAGVTAAFGFGEIEGALDGYVRDLRLLSGKPVAFDAWLASSEDYRGPKLISQRAVDNLSAVGGGPGGAMSRSFLRVFERFRYDAIGLGCKLEKGMCLMRGLERSNGGFLIVRGASLPRITVMGHATRVNWSSLVSRLIAATESGGPVVE